MTDLGATTEFRATFNHGPNEPARGMEISGPVFCSLAETLNNVKKKKRIIIPCNAG